MRRWAARIAIGIALFVFAFLSAVLVNMRSGDTALFPVKPGESGLPVYIVSHGYHSGLVLRREDLDREAEAQKLPVMKEVLTRFKAFEVLEFGWGDEGFYHNVRTIGDLQPVEALRALFLPGNPSVLHVVGLYKSPRETFPSADIIFTLVSETGFSRLAAALDQSFARNNDLHAEEMGVGLYGPSLFYRATGTFNLFNVCNHWVARLLDAAGLPTNPFLATLPKGLFLDLALRAHAQTLLRF
jgi:uncharacterized protein (TIGR02117 family)